MVPINIVNDIVKVVNMWLVIVKLYGIKPSKFPNRTTINMVEIAGK